MSEQQLDLQLRVAHQDDASKVLQVWLDAETRPSTTDDEDAIRARAAREDGLFIVAEAGGRMIGTIMGGWDGWRGNIYRLAVIPAFRRQGVASALVAAVEEQMRRLGVRRVRILAVRPELSEQAVGFWESAGYELADDTLPFAKNLGESGRQG